MVSHEMKILLKWLMLEGSIFIFLFLISTCSEGHSQAKTDPHKVDMKGPLKLVEQTIISGDSRVPFFSVWQPVISDNEIYICDYRGDQILLYDKSGKFIKKIKGRGQGPKEFKMPYGLAMDTKKNLYVTDRGNQRIQVFDADLNFIKTVLTPGQNERILLKESTNQFSIITVGPAACKRGSCLLHEYDGTGKSINDFGNLTKEFIIYSWAASIDDKGNIYIINVLEQEVRVFNREGNEFKKIKLTSPTMRFLKVNLNPTPASQQEVMIQSNILKKKEHTEVSEIFVKNGFLFVFLRVIGIQDPKMLLDIYTEKGDLIYHGIEVPGWLFQINDKLYFVKYDDESDYGSAHFWTYRFIP